MAQTKTKRISIYCGQPLLDFLAARPLKTSPMSQARMRAHGEVDPSEEISESVALNRLAERYAFVMRKSLPDLNKSTWAAIYQALNSRTEHSINEIQINLASIVASDLGLEMRNDETLSDYLVRIELDYGVEFAKLASLDEIETLAVIEQVERYWGID